MNDRTFLSRGIDYLGDIGAKLRDLQGYRTLAHELIQNADDAATANCMSFDVRDDGLIVENDGIFSDCQQIEQLECPWKSDDARGYRCDFHRFRHVAAGDKRGEAGTTGAFGIGFIAVYQITDRPELMSAGRHWKINEGNEEHERIEVCGGCSDCLAPHNPGTRFVFPWARDPNSTLRTALRAEAVPTHAPQLMAEELEKSLGIAMLFLKRLNSIETRRNRHAVRTFQRLADSNSLILSDGDPQNDQVWHIFQGDFSEVAEQLREKHAGRIEAKRTANVSLALPATHIEAGLLCAALPTEQSEGLPFHVNADFFPTNNRKGIILEDDYQSDWNREALKAAARVVGGAISTLPTLIGAKRVWQLVSGLKDIADRTLSSPSKRVLAEFWSQVAPQLRASPVVFSSAGSWVTPADACLLLQREEVGAINVLERLGINVVHEELRPYQAFLRLTEIGVPVLNIERICKALTNLDLVRRTEFAQLPSSLGSPSNREALWVEIAHLLHRQERTTRARGDDERRLRQFALAPGRDEALWPCSKIYSADDDTIALFGPLELGFQFVADEPVFKPLVSLCPRFDATAAVGALEKIDAQELDRLWAIGRLPIQNLLRWFEDRRLEVLPDPELSARLGKLPIFPSAAGLRPLAKLSLPGDFNDPLGLAELVDIDALSGRREFLRDLGMEVLGFSTYVVSRLPEVFRTGGIAVAKRRQAIILLANHIGELKDSEAARIALVKCPLVECVDDTWHMAKDCYFDSETVREYLNGTACRAVLPGEHEAAIRDLYTWLGVTSEPRFSDVAAKIRDISSKPPSPDLINLVQAIIAHLGKRLENGAEPVELIPLRTLKWLPGRGSHNRWYEPNEVYAAYQAFLFESQAILIDLPIGIQGASRNLFSFLGIHLTPSLDLVVKHLLSCAGRSVLVNREVYRFLNDKAGDPALNALKGRRCLLLGESYHAPTDVFWSEHPFGRYRERLGEELRSYSGLLSQLGVKDTPTWSDALRVLQEISAEFGSLNKPLDDDEYSVLMACWRSINQALEVDSAPEDALTKLRGVKCVPNASRVLNSPDRIYFENLAGLAIKFGEYLANNVIPRPVGTVRALSAVGVQALRTAVDTQLLECSNPVSDSKLNARIHSRQNEISRVLENPGLGYDIAKILSQLRMIEFCASDELSIRYRLHAFNRDLVSAVERVPALYLAEEGKLFFVRRESGAPWAAISRELAIALLPDEEPGRFAAGLKEALAAETEEEAAATLDELGFARLDAALATVAPAREPFGAFGAQEPIEDLQMEGPSETHEPSQSATAGDTAPVAPAQTAVYSSPSTSELGLQPPALSGLSNKSEGATEPRKGRPVLRTYIPAPRSQEAETRENAGDDTARRSAVDKAGIGHVLAHEANAGRFPKEMPHTNPGYDVESRDDTGAIVRYIEVKSLSGAWRDSYAVLSRPQFDKACNVGDDFWLYVVEHAEATFYKIHRIQNPALKANHFMFDDGWCATAEPLMNA